MKWYEAIAFMQYKYLKAKDSWEQTRWYGNLFINANSKRKFTLDETIAFPWEKEQVKITKEQVEAERAAAVKEANRILSIINKQKPTVTQT